MKKVLFIGMSPNYGGIETFIMNVFNKLQNNGFRFEFINTSKKNLAYSNYILKKGGIIRKVVINNDWITHFNRYKIAYNFFKKHHNYDIVHLNAVSINVIFWLKAAQKFKINKLIIHSHNDNVKIHSKLKRFFSYFLSIYNNCYLKNNSSYITELAASNSAGNWMFHNSSFQVVNNGIDSNKFLFNLNKKDTIKKSLNINKKDKVLISVARMEYQKNYSKIIHVFSYINSILPNTKLIIIGDGSQKNNVLYLVKKLNIQFNVIFLGIVDNVNDILSVADLMLMPSRYEAFPFSLIESQSAGVPSIVSLEAIPLSSNITNTLKYLSLKKDDKEWAKLSIKMLYKYDDVNYKFKMNKKVANSKYSVNSTIRQIKRIYLK